ncbi:hypothetical protein [Gracilibacillus alcaliphilus]|uniref:hypothetical protein n=1 Tax=Gracilibacillus alcaliphilus TaxID=1401441 RepID=UPI0019593717|nr:hypothetical protein [Gracilibacillus alcaliphilus]MBM7678984.1 hypothetical protein [Gracilibacillus alcaliphilus]
MEVIIKSSNIQFKNPQIGQPTRAVADHYNGRRITALVDGEEQLYRFKKDELAFEVDEDDMIEAIEQRERESQETEQEEEPEAE